MSLEEQGLIPFSVYIIYIGIANPHGTLNSIEKDVRPAYPGIGGVGSGFLLYPGLRQAFLELKSL